MDIGSKKAKTGFTLVEMLVVLAIFSIMLTAIALVFISGTKVQANSLASEQLLEQLNYAVEYMGRSIRMAKKATNANCIANSDNYSSTSSTSPSIGFVDNDGVSDECIYFRLIDSRIYKGDWNDNGFPLTSDDIKITKLSFNISGGAGSSGLQPKVTVLIEAESKSGNPIQKISLQTTISQRDLNKQ